MIPGMNTPENARLAACVTELHNQTPTAAQTDVAFDRIEAYRYAKWDVQPGERDFGYQWSTCTTDARNAFPYYPTGQNSFHLTRHEATAKLTKSNIGDILQAAGVIFETTTSERVDIANTQNHLYYPLTRTFVDNINPALATAGSSLRFEAYEGGEYPAAYGMTRLAEGVLPLGTHPHFNEHDVTYHGFGWLALPNIIIDGIRQKAQTFLSIEDTEERVHQQIECMSNLEHHVNVIFLTRLLEKSMYAKDIGKLVGMSAEQVQTATQQHLYGQPE